MLTELVMSHYFRWKLRAVNLLLLLLMIRKVTRVLLLCLTPCQVRFHTLFSSLWKQINGVSLSRG